MWWLVLPGSAPLATNPKGLALQAATTPCLNPHHESIDASLLATDKGEDYLM